MVQISVGGTLEFYTPGRQRKFEIEVGEGLPVSEIARLLGLPLAEVALVSLNGNVEEDRSVLVREGDELKLFSATDGG